MTTRAREVEAWLRTEEARHRKANTALHSKYGRDYGALLDAAEIARRYADTVAALIAECETAKAELAEAVEVMDRLIDEEPRDGAGSLRELWVYEIDLTATRAFIARPAPAPELITGDAGEEKGETK